MKNNINPMLYEFDADELREMVDREVARRIEMEREFEKSATNALNIMFILFIVGIFIGFLLKSLMS